MENEIYHLKLEEIIPNIYQHREVLDEVSLNELTQSIKQHGVIQPIIVRKKDDKYEIIDGERRYKAAVKAGLSKIPVIVRNYNDNECIRISLVDNLQREDYSPIEEAKMYKKIIENEGMTQEELANNIGKSQSAVANKLRLLNLPFEVQDALLKQEISERHARSLLTVKDTQKQIYLLKKIIEKRMTVRELDSEIKNMSNMFIPEEFKNNNVIDNQLYNDNESYVTTNNVLNNQQDARNNFINNGFVNNTIMDISENESIKENDMVIPQIDPFVPPINDLSEFNIPFNDNQNNNMNTFNIGDYSNNMFINTMEENKENNNPFLTSDSYMPPLSEMNNKNTGNPFSNIRMNSSKYNNSPSPFFTENNNINQEVNNNDATFNNQVDNYNLPPLNNEPIVNNNINTNNSFIPNNIMQTGLNENINYSDVKDNMMPYNVQEEKQIIKEVSNNFENNENEFEDNAPSFNIDDYMLPGVENETNNLENNTLNETSGDINNFNVVDNQVNTEEKEYKYVEEHPNYESVDNPKGVESIDDVINLLRATLDKIKNGKLKVDTQEIDFDDLYQITIKIDKKGDF